MYLTGYFTLNESAILPFQVHVRNHIRSFPWMMSHYFRKDALQKRFLNPNLDIMWMYNLYLEAEETEVQEREKDVIRGRQERCPIPEKHKLAVGEHTYHKVFNSEFNLRFGLPRLDTSWRTTKIRRTKGIKICGETKMRPLIAGVAIPVLYALLSTVPKTPWIWCLSTSCKTFQRQI